MLNKKIGRPRNENKEPKITISSIVDVSIIDKVDEKRQVTRSALIKQLLVQWLKEQESLISE